MILDTLLHEEYRLARELEKQTAYLLDRIKAIESEADFEAVQTLINERGELMEKLLRIQRRVYAEEVRGAVHSEESLLLSARVKAVLKRAQKQDTLCRKQLEDDTQNVMEQIKQSNETMRTLGAYNSEVELLYEFGQHIDYRK